MLKKKGVLKWVLLVTLGTWLIVTVFFYFQHRIQVDTYYIGEYIEFDEFSVYVKNIERYNYELLNYRDYPEILRKLKLPLKMSQAIMKISYFYSQPYHIEKGVYKYRVNCEIIYNTESIDWTYVSLEIYDKFSMGTYNEASSSLEPPNIGGSSMAGNMNIIHYEFKADWEEAYSSGLKFSNKENGEDYLFPFEKPFLTNDYGYFNRRRVDRRQISTDTIKYFLWNYDYGNSEEAENYINEDYVENFPWSTLTQHESSRIWNYEFSYLGRYMDKEKVFIMNISNRNDTDLIRNLDIYMIYEDFKWQIIDAE